MVNDRELREYADADVIVDISMDLYSDSFGAVSVLEHTKDLMLSVLSGKPVVIWAQSLGPFRSKLTSWLVKIVLNRVALITVREEISKILIIKKLLNLNVGFLKFKETSIQNIRA